MREHLVHLSDQIKAAYQDAGKSSLSQFRQLTNEASSQMTLEEWKEMCKDLGYDANTNTWENTNC